MLWIPNMSDSMPLPSDTGQKIWTPWPEAGWEPISVTLKRPLQSAFTLSGVHQRQCFDLWGNHQETTDKSPLRVLSVFLSQGSRKLKRQGLILPSRYLLGHSAHVNLDHWQLNHMEADSNASGFWIVMILVHRVYHRCHAWIILGPYCRKGCTQKCHGQKQPRQGECKILSLQGHWSSDGRWVHSTKQIVNQIESWNQHGIWNCKTGQLDCFSICMTSQSRSKTWLMNNIKDFLPLEPSAARHAMLWRQLLWVFFLLWQAEFLNNCTDAVLASDGHFGFAHTLLRLRFLVPRCSKENHVNVKEETRCQCERRNLNSKQRQVLPHSRNIGIVPCNFASISSLIDHHCWGCYQTGDSAAHLDILSYISLEIMISLSWDQAAARPSPKYFSSGDKAGDLPLLWSACCKERPSSNGFELKSTATLVSCQQEICFHFSPSPSQAKYAACAFDVRAWEKNPKRLTCFTG